MIRFWVIKTDILISSNSMVANYHVMVANLTISKVVGASDVELCSAQIYRKAFSIACFNKHY